MTGDHLARLLDPLSGRVAITSAELLEAVVAAFNGESGSHIDASSLGDAEREALRGYLIKSMLESGTSLYRDVRMPGHLPLYEDTAAKMSWLHQRPCLVCPLGDEIPLHTFPVGVPPWSHQCAPEVGRALRRAIDASPTYREHFRNRVAHGPVCMRIVFVLGEGATMKDCDNMAKGLLDAFQGLLYVDDKQVEHLDLIKVHRSPGSPGYILIRRASTTINDHADVLVPRHGRLAWMSDEELSIGRFLTPP
jgi:Holliday junction resolvase RusA-like endonuclease